LSLLMWAEPALIILWLWTTDNSKGLDYVML